MAAFKLEVFISENKIKKTIKHSASKLLNLQVAEINVRIAVLALETDFTFSWKF